MITKSRMFAEVSPASVECRNFVIGRIVRVEDGRPFVEFAGNTNGAIRARLAVAPPAEFDESVPDRFPVLLLLGNEEPSSPIIFGFVADHLISRQAKNMAQSDRDVLLDGRRMVFTASQEILLRCGKGSIFLGKDGKIVVKGVNIISRASGTNKLKGAAVRIN